MLGQTVFLLQIYKKKYIYNKTSWKTHIYQFSTTAIRAKITIQTNPMYNKSNLLRLKFGRHPAFKISPILDTPLLFFQS